MKNKSSLIVPHISDVSFIGTSEFDCIMEFNGSRYVAWGLFKVGPAYTLKLTHLNMNKMGAKGANHVSKIETFNPLVISKVEAALQTQVTPDFVERFKLGVAHE